MQRFVLHSLIIISVALLSACGGGGGGGSSTTSTISTTDLTGLSSVSITPYFGIVVVGETLQLTATGTYDNGDIRDVTAALDWMSMGGASVNSSGVVTGVSPGSTAVSTYSSQDTDAAAGAIVYVAQYGVDGSVSTPVNVTADSTYHGSVHRGGDNAAPYSYYQLATTPGEAYYIRIENMTADVEVEVFDDAAFSNQLCITSYDASPDDECVVSAPDDGGNLYLRVDGTDTKFSDDNSAAYQLTILRGYTNEGPIDIPLNTPVEGQVGVSGGSSYRFPTVYGGKYTVTVTGLREEVYIDVLGSGGVVLCQSTNPGLEDESCSFQTDETEARLIVWADYWSADLGTPFTVTVTEDHGIYSDEGSIAEPVLLSEGTDHLGQVGSNDSYYSIPTIPGMSYVVSLTAIDSWSRVSVYDGDSNYTDYGYDCSDSTSPESAPAECRMEPVESENLYIKVSGNEFGADYQLNVAEINYQPEGTQVEPVYLMPVPSVYTEPYAGQVDSTVSYYRIDAEVGADYNVTLTGVSGDVAVALYDDASFSSLLCSSDNAGLADESCTTDAPVSGSNLYIAITGDTYGSRFDMTLDRVYNPEGNASSPLDNTSELPTFSGEVATGVDLINHSYYKVNLTAGKTYRFTVSDYTHEDISLLVYDQTPLSESDYSNDYDCITSGIYGITPYTCVVGPLLTDDVTMRLRAVNTEFGAAFAVTVEEITYQQEGSVSTPVDIGSYPVVELNYADEPNQRFELTYDGESSNGSSYYVADISGGYDYVGFTAGLVNQGTDANIYVYEDPSYSIELCSSINGSTADEQCSFSTTSDKVYIRVDGSPSGFGAVYTVVVNGDFNAEGAPLEGNGGNQTGGAMELTMDVPHQGEASQLANSYYTVPATAGMPYTITVSDMFNPVCISVYPSDEGYFTTSYGSYYDFNKSLDDKTMVVTPEVNALYIKLVSCEPSTTQLPGTAYTITVTP